MVYPMDGSISGVAGCAMGSPWMLAAEGIGNRSWKMKRSKLSKRASTRWDELLTVR